MALTDLIQALGDEIQDSDEETFFLFSLGTPSQNLGFIDPKAETLQITVAERELTIEQSPSLLASNRKEGTTGAVVWKITPLFASWIAAQDNILFKTSMINYDSIVLELGCGISGIVGLLMSPKIQSFIATDQEYVFKKLKLNLGENAMTTTKPKTGRKAGPKKIDDPIDTVSNIKVVALDWELSSISSLPSLIRSGSMKAREDISAIVACDCIFNEALVDSFIQTCAGICHLSNEKLPYQPTLCIIAQQLRSHTIFDAWMMAFLKIFRVWRVPDELLSRDLIGGSGFVIHIGILRDLTP